MKDALANYKHYAYVWNFKSKNFEILKLERLPSRWKILNEVGENSVGTFTRTNCPTSMRTFQLHLCLSKLPEKVDF